MEPALANAFKGKICFSLKMNCGEGFVPDKGDVKKPLNGMMSQAFPIKLLAFVAELQETTSLKLLPELRRAYFKEAHIRARPI